MPKYWVRQSFERQEAGAAKKYVAGTKAELPEDVGAQLVADGWLDPPKPVDLAQEKLRRSTAKAKSAAADAAASAAKGGRRRKAPSNTALPGAPETKTAEGGDDQAGGA